MHVSLTERQSTLCAEYRALMHVQLAKRPYFSATVVSWGVENLRNPEAAARSVREAWPILEPLFASSTSCRVFGEDRVQYDSPMKVHLASAGREWPTWASRPAGRKVGLDVQCDMVGRAGDFLSVAFVRGAVAAFALDPTRLDADVFLRHLADPHHITSPFGIAPDAAKPQIRSIVRRSPLVAFITKSAYDLTVEFHAGPALITKLFDRALSTGRRTPGFEKANCAYEVRPFEVGTTLLWEGISRKRHGLEVAIERLEAAESDPNATEWTTPHALAAAELLAALAGAPPQIYTEQEPDRNQRIIAWIQEAQARFSITREQLALARRAVEAIVERSTFPDRRWRTAPVKAQWVQTARDLIDRLDSVARGER